MKVFLNCNKPMFKGQETQVKTAEAKKAEVKTPEVKTEAKPQIKAQPEKDTVEISAPKQAEAKKELKAEGKVEQKQHKHENKDAKCEGEACKK